LFLDEPTSHLDNRTAIAALEWIEHFRKNKIVIWASNLNREFEKYPNHLILSE
jgi:ABC-type multidrug transport system ATPase subunit